jgi:Protein of unknown function (DUF2490)
MALQRLPLLFVFLILSGGLAIAQETQFLPETDLYLKLNPIVRFRVQAMDTRDGGDPNQAAIGPDLNIFLKPLISLEKVAAFDLDEAKSRPLIFAVGYRYIDAPDSPYTNRMILMATSNLPVKTGLLLTDRNRSDLDWSDGKFNWRYRNKLQAEKPLTVRSYHPSPYLSVEVYYEEQYHKWSTTELYAGCSFPTKKHFELDPYYEHQNNTGKSPNSQVNGIGIKLNLFFSTK